MLLFMEIMPENTALVDFLINAEHQLVFFFIVRNIVFIILILVTIYSSL